MNRKHLLLLGIVSAVFVVFFVMQYREYATNGEIKVGSPLFVTKNLSDFLTIGTLHHPPVIVKPNTMVKVLDVGTQGSGKFWSEIVLVTIGKETEWFDKRWFSRVPLAVRPVLKVAYVSPKIALRFEDPKLIGQPVDVLQTDGDEWWVRFKSGYEESWNKHDLLISPGGPPY